MEILCGQCGGAFVPFAGMPDHIQQERGRMPRSMGTHADGQDVFCLVKSTMASKELAQDPLLVWPASLEGSANAAFELANDPSCPTQTCEIDDERSKELRALRMALKRDFPQMHRVVAWYDSLVSNEQSTERPVPLTFLREAKAHRVNWGDFRLGQRAPDPKPHELQVVFHRG